MEYHAKMAARRKEKLSDQLRQIIDESGLSRYRIAKDLGVNESGLGKFLNGDRGVSTKLLDALGEYFELEFRARRKFKETYLRETADG
jgi:transcriptional regulator with XRE-family HTH domain